MARARCSAFGTSVCHSTLILHEVHALALRGVRHDRSRPATAHPERLFELLMVVAVDLDDLPAERPPLVRERLEAEDVLRAAEDLQPVAVDHDGDIAETVVRGHQCRLPVAALGALAIGHDHEHPPVDAVEPVGQGPADAERQRVTQRPGGQLDAGDPVSRHMAAEVRAVLVVVVQPRQREVAGLGEHGVHARRRVPLRHQHDVAGRVVHPVWGHVGDVAVEDGQDVDDGEGSADVRGARTRAHREALMRDRRASSVASTGLPPADLLGHHIV